MMLRSSFAIALALLAFALAPTAAAAESIDEQQTSGTNYSEDTNWYQTVTVDATRMTKIELMTYSTCSSGKSPLHIKITTSSDYNSNVLADSDGIYAAGTSPAWQTVDFADFSTSPGQVLYIHFRPTTISGPWACTGRFMVASTNPYTRGDPSWGTTWDLAFKLWGDYYETSIANRGSASSTLFGAGDSRYFTFALGAGYGVLTISQSGAGDFDLYVKAGSRPTLSTYDCRPFTGSSSETCTFNNPAAATYYIMSNDYSGSGSVTITVDANHNPTAAVQSSPTNSATGVARNPTLSWSGSTDGDSDTVRYSVYLDTGATPTTLVCGAQTGTSCTASGLAYSTTYRWRVLADDGHGGQVFTATTFAFTTAANQPPNAFDLSSPSNSATNQGRSVTLSWQSTTDPGGESVQYTPYLDTSATPTTLQCVASSSTSCTVSNLDYSVTYHWRVKAADSLGAERYSTSTFAFTTAANQPPNAFDLSSPSNGATNQPLSLTLSWQSTSDPGGEAVQFTPYLDTSSTPTTQKCSPSSATSCSVTGLSYSTTYRWRVKAADSLGAERYSTSTYSLTTQAPPNNAPGTPSNSSPGSGATGVARTPTFSWSSTGDPDSGDTVDFTVVANGQNVCTARYSTTSCTSTINLGKGTSVSWHVNAVDNHGATSSSSSTSFTTLANRPPTASFTSSTNGLTVNFDGTGSSDPDGDALSYVWYVPDGATTYMYYTATPSRTFSCNQASDVLLQVQDTDFAWTEVRHTVNPADTRDSDGDGLVACREAAQGTSDSDPDTDNDGVSDNVESQWFADRVATFCNASGTACMTPHPTEPDLYVEMDWYQGHYMNGDSTNQVIDRYNNAPRSPPIHLQVDLGQYGGGGTDLGSGSTVTYDNAAKNRQTSMSSARQPYFHYGVVACQQPGDIAPVWYDPSTWHQAWGLGGAPGNFFIIYECNFSPEVPLYVGDRQVFQHELGHNVLGEFFDHRSGCDWQYDHWHNPSLSHFRGTEDGTNCAGTANGAADTWSHSPDGGDLMNNHFQYSDDFTDATWRAIRLDWAPGGNGIAPDCPTPLATVSQLVDPSVLGCGIAQPLHADYGDELLPQSNVWTRAPPTWGAMGLVVLGLVCLVVRRRAS